MNENNKGEQGVQKATLIPSTQVLFHQELPWHSAMKNTSRIKKTMS